MTDSAAHHAWSGCHRDQKPGRKDSNAPSSFQTPRRHTAAIGHFTNLWHTLKDEDGTWRSPDGYGPNEYFQMFHFEEAFRSSSALSSSPDLGAKAPCTAECYHHRAFLRGVINQEMSKASICPNTTAKKSYILIYLDQQVPASWRCIFGVSFCWLEGGNHEAGFATVVVGG